MDLLIHLDRDMDLKMTVTVPVGSTIGAVKQMLAQSDPTGTVDPSSFALKESGPASRALGEKDLVPGHVRELEVCEPHKEIPQDPLPPVVQRKRAGPIPPQQWEQDCKVAFELAYPPQWEFQERDLGPRSIWSSLPESVNATMNAMSWRGQRMGTVHLGSVELSVDLQELSATPAGARATRRRLRKHSHQPAVDPRELMRLFLRYADEIPVDGDLNEVDGIEGIGLLEFFEDLGVDPASDVAALAFSWACQARVMGTFRRREFICGCARLEADNLETLRSKVNELRRVLASGKILPEVYAYTYGVALEPPVKVLPLEDACQYWALLLPAWGLREEFCKWAEQHMKGKAVNRDLWMMVLKFAQEVPADLSTYDEDPAWPVVLDEFVDSCRANRT